jgi:hypothetical protein
VDSIQKVVKMVGYSYGAETLANSMGYGSIETDFCMPGKQKSCQ